MAFRSCSSRAIVDITMSGDGEVRKIGFSWLVNDVDVSSSGADIVRSSMWLVREE